MTSSSDPQQAPALQQSTLPSLPGPDLPTRPEISDAPTGRLGEEGLTPVSEKLIPARYLAGILGYVIGLLLTAGSIVAAVLTGWWWLALPAPLFLLIVLQGLLLTPRRVRAIGYRVGEDDLTVAGGIMFRTVQTVPFGRVQSVKIDEGPIARRYGLTTLTVSTATDGDGVTLSGLPREEAEQLRALLAARGIELMAAL